MTLYTFDHDSPCSETTACVGSCPANWPPLTAADDPVAAPGVTGQLDTIERDDGTRHVTYKGNRLYRSSLDTAPGDTNGDGVAGVWHVARP
jgi:predicted lipoprotein with Yx(FWY)xxD motif